MEKKKKAQCHCKLMVFVITWLVNNLKCLHFPQPNHVYFRENLGSIVQVVVLGSGIDSEAKHFSYCFPPLLHQLTLTIIILISQSNITDLHFDSSPQHCTLGQTLANQVDLAWFLCLWWFQHCTRLHQFLLFMKHHSKSWALSTELFLI